MIAYNTSIDEDLKEIEKIFLNVESEKDLPEMVQEIDNKLGLSLEKGKYVLNGAVTTGKVFKRSEHSRSGEAVGYSISRIDLDESGNPLMKDGDLVLAETKYVTKDECLQLVQFKGATNAYIRLNGGKTQNTKVYLRPFPAKTQAFFLDGRVVHAYKLDEYGERLFPLELAIDESKCTVKLYTIIKNDFNLKKKKEKMTKNFEVIKRENNEKMERIKQVLFESNQALVNPFNKK